MCGLCADSRSFPHTDIRNCLVHQLPMSTNSDDSDISRGHLPLTRPARIASLQRHRQRWTDSLVAVRNRKVAVRFPQTWPLVRIMAKNDSQSERPVESQLANVGWCLAMFLRARPETEATRLRLCHGVSTAGAPCKERRRYWEEEEVGGWRLVEMSAKNTAERAAGID
ncbi:hypothetical protein TrVFT333_005678 [Trichoderma virens FT-333]|nr:hypothetical protein TrVFT333_005678 [Trichoderma virens FT-333]